MKELELWRFISERHSGNIPVILMTVLESQGSSPGRCGFKMAVTETELFGSIGGGIMEHKFVELAKERLKAATDTAIIRKQIHNKVAKRDQSGMICSGEQTIFLLAINDNDIEHIRRLIHSLEKTKNGKLVITEDGINYSDEMPLNDFNFQLRSEESFIYEEKTGFKNTLYVIGGGHCSLAFTRLMSSMDFYIHLYDDREGLNTFLNNDFVHTKKILSDYSELKDVLASGPNSYVVIMTFGYRTDDLALRSVIDKDFTYIGVLGSKNKINQLKEEWKNSGISEEKLARIHSPIGLSINSQTPEEIAISIAAEIISIKNR